MIDSTLQKEYNDNNKTQQSQQPQQQPQQQRWKIKKTEPYQK
jgi:hypothetical protein